MNKKDLVFSVNLMTFDHEDVEIDDCALGAGICRLILHLTDGKRIHEVFIEKDDKGLRICMSDQEKI